MGIERISQLWSGEENSDRTAFLPFMTAGLPDPESSSEVLSTLLSSGADGIELGIPYSDPLMDGPIIRAGSEQAIAAGTTPERALSILAQVRAANRTAPILVMSYYNPILSWGLDRFAREVAGAGGDGVIVADLPVEESTGLAEALSEQDLGLVLFVAPTSGDQRIAAVVAAEPVFIYAVADLGVTGKRVSPQPLLTQTVTRIRQHSDLPLVAGVGISTPDQAAQAAKLVDGVIVGSVLVETVLNSPDLPTGLHNLRTLTQQFRDRLRAVSI